ncbi:hypothetical protein, partial [Xenorhabdus bovienii]|uniref:hypothetical protein n=1 Tax=Xenorhabdus bovienii TaxID=40576 RepID=UPI001E65A966
VHPKAAFITCCLNSTFNLHEKWEDYRMRLLRLVNTAPNRGANTAGIPLVSGNYFGSVWRVGL